MTEQLDPVVDNWYTHLDKGQTFQVVSVDAEEQVVEIQHFDGDIEEIDFSDWYNMEIELSENPENISGAVDIENTDDYGDEITDTSKEDWDEPLEEIHGGQEDTGD